MPPKFPSSHHFTTRLSSSSTNNGAPNGTPSDLSRLISSLGKIISHVVINGKEGQQGGVMVRKREDLYYYNRENGKYGNVDYYSNADVVDAAATGSNYGSFSFTEGTTTTGYKKMEKELQQQSQMATNHSASRSRNEKQSDISVGTNTRVGEFQQQREATTRDTSSSAVESSPHLAADIISGSEKRRQRLTNDSNNNNTNTSSEASSQESASQHPTISATKQMKWRDYESILRSREQQRQSQHLDLEEKESSQRQHSETSQESMTASFMESHSTQEQRRSDGASQSRQDLPAASTTNTEPSAAYDTACSPSLHVKESPLESRNIVNNTTTETTTQSLQDTSTDTPTSNHHETPHIPSTSENSNATSSLGSSDTATPQSQYIPLKDRKSLGNARAVPSSSLGRAWGFGSLITKVAWNTATGRYLSGNNNNGSIKSSVATEQNAQLIADTLCRMRGAALKLGQMISIQDSNMIPQPIIDAFERVRDQADYMPEHQLRSVLINNFGDSWDTEVFSSFDMTPIAAASIGQVHKAVLKNGDPVAVKIQYPGVAKSMESDIRNLERIIKYTNILPRGAFIDSSIAQARYELSLECDYRIEAQNQEKYASLVEQDSELKSRVSVPKVYTDLSSEHVLVTELVQDAWTLSDLAARVAEERKKYGEPRIITREKCNEISSMVLSLCLKEVFLYQFMQTDPNWSNFFYSPSEDRLYLIDFGACSEYPTTFTDPYMQLVYGAATKNPNLIMDASVTLGFLTGEESSVMKDAHLQASYIIGAPFQPENFGREYDFEKQDMTKKIQNELPVMLRHRLTPPPKLSYALHRKLSGAFLLCCKFGARTDSAAIFKRIYEQYQLEHPEVELPDTERYHYSAESSSKQGEQV